MHLGLQRDRVGPGGGGDPDRASEGAGDRSAGGADRGRAGVGGAERLGGFVTPYLPEVSQTMRDRLETAGFSIAGFGSFEEGGDDRVVARISEEAIAKAAIRVAEAAPCDAW